MLDKMYLLFKSGLVTWKKQVTGQDSDMKKIHILSKKSYPVSITRSNLLVII